MSAAAATRSLVRRRRRVRVTPVLLAVAWLGCGRAIPAAASPSSPHPSSPAASLPGVSSPRTSLPSGSSPQTRPPAAPPKAADAAPLSWQVQLVSEGGLTGKGLGSVGARSDGTLQLLERAAARDSSSGPASYQAICSMPLTSAQAADLSKAVAAASPAGWEPRYARTKNPYIGGDEVLWTLTFERTSAAKGVEQRVVQWVGERAAALPEDLARLRAALLAVKPDGGCTM